MIRNEIRWLKLRDHKILFDSDEEYGTTYGGMREWKCLCQNRSCVKVARHNLSVSHNMCIASMLLVLTPLQCLEASLLSNNSEHFTLSPSIYLFSRGSPYWAIEILENMSIRTVGWMILLTHTPLLVLQLTESPLILLGKLLR
jgi:hypothetical protein